MLFSEVALKLLLSSVEGVNLFEILQTLQIHKRNPVPTPIYEFVQPKTFIPTGFLLKDFCSCYFTLKRKNYI